MKKVLKKNEKIILIVFATLLLTGGIAFAASQYNANQIKYDTTTVAGALDNLYNYAKNKSDLAEKMQKPNTWEVGVEQNFGGGVYGIRLKGSFKAGSNEKQADFNSSFLESSRPVFLQVGGWITLSSSDANRLSYNGYYWSNTNYMIGTFVGYPGHIRYQLMDSDASRTHEYDVWATYTK